jgi:hypothetical protein
VSKALHPREKIWNRTEPDRPFSKTAARQDLGLQFCGITKEELLPHANLSTGTHEAVPVIRVCGNLPGKKYFNPSLEKVPRRWIPEADRLCPMTAPMPIEPGRKYAGVVENQEVTLMKQTGEIAKLPVFNCFVAPLEVEQAGSCPIRERFLRNPLRRQVILEIGNQHSEGL